MVEKKIFIEGMHCKSCTLLIHETMMHLEGVKNAAVNLQEKSLTLSFDPQKISEAMIFEAIRECWYRALEKKGKGTERISKDKKVWQQTIISLFIILALIIFIQEKGLGEISSIQIGHLTGFWWMVILWLVAGISTCIAVAGGLLSSFIVKRSVSWGTTRPQLRFHTGRLIAFITGGALLGSVGAGFQLGNGGYAVLFLMIWIVMIITGLNTTELFPFLRKFQIGLPASWWIHAKGHTMGKKRDTEWFFLGMITFIIPCGFTLIAMASAVNSWSFFGGARVMAWFAVWTLPWLIWIGVLSAFIKSWWRAIVRFFGLVIVAFGVYNLVIAYQNLQGILLRRTAVMDTIESTVVQEIMITQDNGYSPSSLTVKPGKIKLTVNSKNQYNCSAAFMIPSKWIKAILQPWNNTFEFTANRWEIIQMMCSMGMYRGTIKVEQ